MRREIFLLLIIGILSTGCSTMVSPKKTSVFINSTKNGQAFIVKDSKGTVVAKAVTPAVIKLNNKGDSSYTYLTQCENKLEESKINAWVLGNIVMASISGILIDIRNGYSNEPANKVSLANCDKVIAKKREKVAKGRYCVNYVHKYDRSIYKFNDKKNKNSINDLKNAQDYLLAYCSEYIDISHYKNQASTINKVYESYL